MYENEIEKISSLIQASERILFITGAGLSADSGLPTYRGIGGLYDQEDTEDDVPIEVALSGDMLHQCPEITWKYLLEIERACRGAGHNIAHKIIADLEALKPASWVLTQNVDGFHRQAGSNNVIEIHGRVGELFCTRCDYSEEVSHYGHIHESVPGCPHCEAVIRPSVVLFGEALPETAIHDLHREMLCGFDLVLSIGTTSVFPYISQPVLEARHWGAKTVEINPGITEVSAFVDIKLPIRAAQAMQKIWMLLDS